MVCKSRGFKFSSGILWSVMKTRNFYKVRNKFCKRMYGFL